MFVALLVRIWRMETKGIAHRKNKYDRSDYSSHHNPLQNGKLLVIIIYEKRKAMLYYFGKSAVFLVLFTPLECPVARSESREVEATLEETRFGSCIDLSLG
jgi:hypothetical protein